MDECASIDQGFFVCFTYGGGLSLNLMDPAPGIPFFLRMELFLYILLKGRHKEISHHSSFPIFFSKLLHPPPSHVTVQLFPSFYPPFCLLCDHAFAKCPLVF